MKAVRLLPDTVIHKFSSQIIYDTLSKTPYRIYLPDSKATNKQHGSLTYVTNVVDVLSFRGVIQTFADAQERSCK